MVPRDRIELSTPAFQGCALPTELPGIPAEFEGVLLLQDHRRKINLHRRWRERAGFEPRDKAFWPCDGLANRCLSATGHLSALPYLDPLFVISDPRLFECDLLSKEEGDHTQSMERTQVILVNDFRESLLGKKLWVRAPTRPQCYVCRTL